MLPSFPSVGISSTLFAIALLVSSETPVHAATPYKLTVIAQAGDVVAGQTIIVPGNGVMNDSGTIAFSACGSSDFPYNCHVYRTSLSTLAAGPSLVAAGSGPKIDNAGTILFGCQDSAAICTQSGVLVKSGDTIGGQKIDSVSSYAISGNGAILFLGGWGVTPINPPFGGSTVASGLFTPSALVVKTCEKYLGPNPCIAGGVPGSSVGGQMLSSVGQFAINNSGTIAFDCNFNPPGGFPYGYDGLCTPSSIVARASSVIGGRTLNSIGGIGLNDA